MITLFIWINHGDHYQCKVLTKVEAKGLVLFNINNQITMNISFDGRLLK